MDHAPWALVALAIAVAANTLIPLLEVPATVIGSDANGLHVTSVLLGSEPWQLGVRPGTEVVRWPVAAEGAPGYEAVIGGTTIGYPVTPPWSTEPLLVGLGISGASFFLERLGLPGRGLLVTLGVGLLLRPVLPALGLPWVIPFALLPTMAAVATRRRPDPAAGRLMGAVTLAVATLLVACYVIVLLIPSAPWPWDLLWAAPAAGGMAVVLAAVAAVAAPVGRETAGMSVTERARALIMRVVPLARRAALDAQQGERTRIARQIHNEILPLVGTAMQSVDRRDPGAPAGSAELEATATALRGMITDRQSLAVERLGLAAALDAYVTALGPTWPPVEQRITHAGERPPLRVELAVYRIAQAALNNALTHASADHVALELRASARSVLLRISDDGVGIDPKAERAAIARGHYGLAEMRSQAEACRAGLAVRSTPAGTTVELRWNG